MTKTPTANESWPRNLKIDAGEHPACGPRELYLAARLELAAYLAERPPALDDDITVKQRIPSDAELLAERERLAQGVR